MSSRSRQAAISSSTTRRSRALIPSNVNGISTGLKRASRCSMSGAMSDGSTAGAAAVKASRAKAGKAMRFMARILSLTRIAILPNDVVGDRRRVDAEGADAGQHEKDGHDPSLGSHGVDDVAIADCSHGRHGPPETVKEAVDVLIGRNHALQHLAYQPLTG